MNIAHLTFNNYILKIGGQYKLLHQQVDLIQISTVSRTCSSNIERTISAISYVSGHSSELIMKGRTVFFSIRFLQYVHGTPFFSNIVGPFSFEGKE